MLNHPSPGVIASSIRTGPASRLFGWGQNATGQLGDGTTANKSSPVPIGAATNWTEIAAAGVATNVGFSLGIKGGALFSWGANNFGQLGTGNTTGYSNPTPVGAATNWTKISAGGGGSSQGFSIGIRGGALFTWGRNATGQLGDGTTANKSSPVPIGAATNWTRVAAGSESGAQGFSIGISGGALFTWGQNATGQLGDGTTANKSSPVPIGAATNWTEIAAAGSATTGGFSLGISGGALFAWGSNGTGQLGDSTITNKSSPVPIGAATNWTVISAGNDPNTGRGFSLGIRGGVLFGWGNNSTGQLGTGNTTGYSSPVPVGAATNWTAVSAGGDDTSVSSHGFAFGIRGGALFTWGDNSTGQLGDGTTANKSSPVPIGALTTWTKVATGGGGSVTGGFGFGLRG